MATFIDFVFTYMRAEQSGAKACLIIATVCLFFELLTLSLLRRNSNIKQKLVDEILARRERVKSYHPEREFVEMSKQKRLLITLEKQYKSFMENESFFLDFVTFCLMQVAYTIILVIVWKGNTVFVLPPSLVRDITSGLYTPADDMVVTTTQWGLCCAVSLFLLLVGPFRGIADFSMNRYTAIRKLLKS